MREEIVLQHCTVMIKAKVTVCLEIISPFATIQTGRSYKLWNIHRSWFFTKKGVFRQKIFEKGPGLQTLGFLVIGIKSIDYMHRPTPVMDIVNRRLTCPTLN